MDGLDRIVGVIRGRVVRVIYVVILEMDNYELGVYIEKVLEVIKLFFNIGVGIFFFIGVIYI